jgi:5-methylcytosine-specific restriction endonuclease McrA
MHCKPCSSKNTAEWQRNNPEVRKAWEEQNLGWQAKWRAKNPDKVLEATRRNHPKWRARKRNAKVVETITLDGLYLRDKGICGICKREVLRCDASHDHKIPLSRGGDHSWDNAQLAHFNCNSRKKDRTQEEYEAYVESRVAATP